MSDRQRHGFVLLLVAGLIAASLFVIFSQKTQLGLDLKGGIQLVYEGKPSPRTPHVTQDALNRAVDIMRQRVDQLGVSEPEIQTTGSNLITVGLPAVQNTSRAESEVGTTAQLYFYDWEANALTPNGKTVASQLQAQDPTAVQISQGTPFAPPGSPNAGSRPLYEAVKLASQQPRWISPHNARLGPQYYLFGAPGSAACAAKSKQTGQIYSQHCLLAGPDNETYSTSHKQAIQDLVSQLPPGVNVSDGELLVVPQGTVVLQATNPSARQQIKFDSPEAQFYVLRDKVALRGSDITNPQQSTDQAGNPDVTFGFNGAGGNAFQNVTAQIARRGQQVSTLGQKYQQHFAVALDNQLVTVPAIDYNLYPDGIAGGNGADITGGFTQQSASDLANVLRLGALPINLQLISESQVSATLGKQALHQGLIAGAVGLLIVALFLIIYYRILGLIAVAGLAVYALYFYALIKLIPIVLTLPGIAGLILTIGVAADANIVIFERVKEEIRAGRSIRSGIAIGYKKGLTAIIDANVVTIMTAFILFVLATAQVQGFAFTLGIGTMVSLFTAVLATQAILMTMGDSRTIARLSALGVSGKKHVWKFDFMGASRYFFSMSGVILLIGALAIGGRGLNLGIDFTSGTRITATLSKPATASQVTSVVSNAGAAGPNVQKLGSRGNEFQISSKLLRPNGVTRVEDALNSHFGLVSHNDESVGPTFGRTVANSAVIAIIASLLVISAYVALRFEWKFALPVLIALMHDLLITSGVYALTGREVTVDTVAALLTILGYSMYDTIIVFDRVRENVPRMPRAAFSQIVNRSMSEVLTRSIATTSCTLIPIVCLLLFGGSTLKDFAFALMIGVASGAYSSIFIASPVLTHWKEREPAYRARRHRIEAELGMVPAYAAAGADVEPTRERARRPPGRLTHPEPDTVSAAEFEQLKRDIADEQAEPSRQTSTLTKRLARSSDTDAARSRADAAAALGRRATRKQRTKPQPAQPRPAAGDGVRRAPAGGDAVQRAPADGDQVQQRAPADRDQVQQRAPADGDRVQQRTPPDGDRVQQRAPADGDQVEQRAPAGGDRVQQRAPASGEAVQRAPDVAENDGVAPVPKSSRTSKSRSRSRRHGRRR
jgi:SecD/SecF fusion protein